MQDFRATSVRRCSSRPKGRHRTAAQMQSLFPGVLVHAQGHSHQRSTRELGVYTFFVNFQGVHHPLAQRRNTTCRSQHSQSGCRDLCLGQLCSASRILSVRFIDLLLTTSCRHKVLIARAFTLPCLSVCCVVWYGCVIMCSGCSAWWCGECCGVRNRERGVCAMCTVCAVCVRGVCGVVCVCGV